MWEILYFDWLWLYTIDRFFPSASILDRFKSHYLLFSGSLNADAISSGVAMTLVVSFKLNYLGNALGSDSNLLNYCS